MPRAHRPPSTVQQPAISRPAGAPEWVTVALLEDTLAAWQPYYPHPLTVDDALEILLTVGRLFDALGDDEREQPQVFGSSSRKQP